MDYRTLFVVAALASQGCNADDGDGFSAGLSAGATQGPSDPLETTGGVETSSGDVGVGDGADESASAPATTGEASTTSTTTTSATESTSTVTSASTSGSGSDSDFDGSSSTGDDGSGIVDGVLDIGIIAHNDCTFTVEPASITVPEGTEFTVNWISDPNSEIEFDIAKIDQFNQVAIVLGMEPASSYHDFVREWCGTLFTGTFDFRLTSCHDPLYIPVDCGG